jgi:exopolyphosphatase / guanosine-5'-triphosphate,3'-diphosphate pyrophosphatase
MPSNSAESANRTIAAIDIGTNSAHMVVADMDPSGTMKLRDSDKVNLRLGKAVDADGNITKDGIERTVEALAHMHEIIAPYKAQVRAVATHAVREAPNHRHLIKEIKDRAGIQVELIDGIEEARLVFLGMRYGLALAGIPCLGVDVGGGSTEIIIARDDDIQFVSSFKLGAVTLTEKYFGPLGYTNSAVKTLKDHIRSRLAPLPHETENCTMTRALASSGTAKALAFVHSRLFGGNTVNDPNGYILPVDGLFQILEIFQQKLTPAKIKEATGLESARADIIFAGAMILGEVSRLLRIEEWSVTTFGLREGLVADTFYRANDECFQNLPDIQWNSVLSFGKSLRIDQPHAQQVMRLSMRLFELLAPKLRPDEKHEDLHADLKLLRAAAYLREAGKFLSAPQYHHHSQYLISNSRLPGFTEFERIMMGLIARFHRKGIPSSSHPDCADLAPRDLKRLSFLSGIVRLAAALDRTRHNRVRQIEAAFDKEGNIVIELYHDIAAIPDVELHKASLELGALEKSLGAKLQIKLRGV